MPRFGRKPNFFHRGESGTKKTAWSAVAASVVSQPTGGTNETGPKDVSAEVFADEPSTAGGVISRGSAPSRAFVPESACCFVPLLGWQPKSKTIAIITKSLRPMSLYYPAKPCLQSRTLRQLSRLPGLYGSTKMPSIKAVVRQGVAPAPVGDDCVRGYPAFFTVVAHTESTHHFPGNFVLRIPYDKEQGLLVHNQVFFRGG